MEVFVISWLFQETILGGVCTILVVPGDYPGGCFLLASCGVRVEARGRWISACRDCRDPTITETTIPTTTTQGTRETQTPHETKWSERPPGPIVIDILQHTLMLTMTQAPKVSEFNQIQEATKLTEVQERRKKRPLLKKPHLLHLLSCLGNNVLHIRQNCSQLLHLGDIPLDRPRMFCSLECLLRRLKRRLNQRKYKTL